MPSRLREPFGKAGLIVAIVALVASLAGGAIAADLATDSGKRNNKRAKKNKKKKQKGLTVAQVRRIAKQEARKFANSNPGAPGLQGPAGPAGPKGDKGSSGSSGSNGTSATVASFAGSNGTCTEGQGGLEVKSASPTAYVCNGLEGEEGSPWTELGTLPSEETETGAFAVFDGLEGGKAFEPISFSVPLASPLEGGDVHYVTAEQIEEGENGKDESEGGPPAACQGTAADPEAESGHLCVYERDALNAVALGIINPATLGFGAATAGAFIQIVESPAESGFFQAMGTWAVTAP